MGKLLNVRLSDAESAIVDRLKKEGSTVSDVVRAAIRKEYQKRIHQEAPSDPVAFIAWLDKEYPVAPNGTRRCVDTADRLEVARYIRQHLRRKLKGRRPGTFR